MHGINRKIFIVKCRISICTSSVESNIPEIGGLCHLLIRSAGRGAPFSGCATPPATFPFCLASHIFALPTNERDFRNPQKSPAASATEQRSSPEPASETPSAEILRNRLSKSWLTRKRTCRASRRRSSRLYVLSQTSYRDQVPRHVLGRIANSGVRW